MSNTKNTKNVTIALLTISAVLLGLVFVGSMNDNQAYAEAAAVGGRYLMINAENGSFTDMIFVIDIFDQTINVYIYNRQTHRLEPADQVDLRKAFRASAAGRIPAKGSHTKQKKGY